MNILAVILTSFASSFLLVLLFLGSPTLLGLPMIDIAGLVGLTFTPNRWRARIIGIFLILLETMLFSVICAAIWNAGATAASLPTGLIFGGAAGTITLAGLALFLRRHPRQPLARQSALDLVGICWWFGHLLSGLLAALIYPLV